MESMGKLNPIISVIMLTYNREKYVGRAIESILQQTFWQYELILVDNGSSDRSGKICDEYASKDARIHVIHKNKGNIGSGRNRGLEVALGRYITFVDDDDIAAADMLQFLYDLIEEHQADVSVCGSTKWKCGKLLPNLVFDECLIWNTSEAVIELLKREKINAATPTKLWSRKLFEKEQFLENGKYDDINVVYKLLANAKKIVAFGIPKYCFWRHEENNSAFTDDDKLITAEQLDEYLWAYQRRTTYLSHVLPDIVDFVKYSEWSFLISMYHKITKEKLLDCQSKLSEINSVLSKNYDAFYNSGYIQEFEKRWLELYIGGQHEGK